MGGRAKAGVKKYQCISCSWEPQFIDFLVPHLQELSVGVNKDGSVSLCILMLWSGMCCRVQGCEEWVLWASVFLWVASVFATICVVVLWRFGVGSTELNTGCVELVEGRECLVFGGLEGHTICALRFFIRVSLCFSSVFRSVSSHLRSCLISLSFSVPCLFCV